MGNNAKQIVPVVLTVVAVVATVYAGPMVGSAIMEYALGAEAAAAASAATTAAVGSAAIGGSTSAVNAAVQGKNIEGVLKAGAIGAASSAAASGVASSIGPEVLPAGQAGPNVPVDSATRIAQGAASGATKGFTQAELSGSNLKQAERQGLIGGATGATTAAIGEGLQGAGVSSQDAKLATALAGPYISQDYSNLFSPQKSSGTTGSGSQSTQLVGTSPTTGQGAPGSAALGQALRIGDPGAPIESPGGGETSKQPVWNIASLRTKDETGSSS